MEYIPDTVQVNKKRRETQVYVQEITISLHIRLLGI